MPAKEIERKFLVLRLPDDLQIAESHEISQGYVCFSGSEIEIRLRKKGSSHYLTVKKGSGRIREEAEIEINEDQFNKLWHFTSKKRLKKTRLDIKFPGGKYEIDIYKGKLNGLRTVEVEFPSKIRAENFVQPEWFGREITNDFRYSNRNLAIDGLPEE